MLGPDAATGHTADDQAETVLANLLRGAGVHGLAGMRAGPGHPLLGLRRAETVALCELLGLDPVQDPSNDDPRFVRNRVRHELLPLCSAIAGRDVVPVLARQADAAGRRRRHPRRGGLAGRSRGRRRAGRGAGGRGRRARPRLAHRRRVRTRRRSTPSSGCSRWPGRSDGRPRSPAAGGCPAPDGRLSLTRRPGHRSPGRPARGLRYSRAGDRSGRRGGRRLRMGSGRAGSRMLPTSAG